MANIVRDFSARRPEHYPADVHEVREHGGRFVQCLRCGAIYSVVETSGGPDFECIEHGDGWCLEHYPEGDQ